MSHCRVSVVVVVITLCSVPGCAKKHARGADAVQVHVSERGIDMPGVVKAGTVTYHVVNDGGEKCDFGLQQDVGFGKVKRSWEVAPHETRDVEIESTAGSYTVDCSSAANARDPVAVTVTIQ